MNRIELYKEIESIRKKPLISYVTTVRQDINVQMAIDVIPEIIKQIELIPENEKEIDFLIISNGGDPLVSYRIMSLLRERFDKITVIIPYIAYSAATLLALGADEIIMHPYGNLGPIDPQVTIYYDNKEKIVSYTDVIKYMEFTKDIGIKSEEFLQKSFDKLTDEISPTNIGIIKKSFELGNSLGKKLLSMHEKDDKKVNEITEILNTKFYHHGYPLSKKEAENIGLNIKKIDKKLENLLWELAQNIMEDLNFNIPFNPEEIAFNEIIKNQNEIGKQNCICKKEKIAIVESKDKESSFSNEIISNYVIMDDGKINQNIIIKNGYWK